jgi:xanthine dehydrogenase accessory factor
MQDLLPTIDAWEKEGVLGGRAVVVRTFGSAPRPEGAVLLLSTDGRLAGSVSGGCVEGAAAEEIVKARADGRSRVIRYGISDEQAWDVGLACGGTIDVLIEPAIAAEAIDAARAIANGSRAAEAVITPLPADAPPPEFGPHQPSRGEPPARPIVVRETPAGEVPEVVEVRPDLSAAVGEAIRTGRSRTVVAGGASFFVEAFVPRPRLVVVGAVEVARWLVRLAAEVGFETVVVDGRPAFATAERFPSVDDLLVEWPDEAFERLGVGPTDSIAILSHDPKFDEPAIVEAFRRGCRYVGAVGSRKTQEGRRDRLRQAGVSDDDLARLHGPIGLDLGGRDPGETALAILAEVVAARRGGSGAPLVERARARAGA